MGDNFHDLRSGHPGHDPHITLAAAHLLPDGQNWHDTQVGHAVGDIFTNQPPTAKWSTTPNAGTLSDGWLELRTFAELFDDAQKARIAAGNRALATGRPETYAAHVEALRCTEHACQLMLRRCYRRVVPAPIRQWQEDTPGIGIDMLARLLGHLGDPVIAYPHHWEGTKPDRVLVADEPYERTVAQLWAYCGHGDPGRRKFEGMTANDLFALGSPKIKMLVRLNAEMCFRCVGTARSRRSPYRDLYEARRLVTADRVHATPCAPCGPKGKPRPAGSPWKAGHQHADALRIVGKEILKDLWQAAR